MGRWETTSRLEAVVAPAAIWAGAYADAAAWPRWNPEPAPAGAGGSRLTNTVYVEGPLSSIWRRLLGPRAARALPDSQAAIVALAAGGAS